MEIVDQDIKVLKVLNVKTRQDFLFFCRYFFKAQYKTKYKQWDHLLIIADALQRVARGEVTRLIINVAPRYGKCVSLRTMILTTEGLKTAADLKIGDKLYCHKEGKVIIETCMGKEPARKQSVKIKMRSGREIECSHDHPMLTTFGYIKAEEIKPGERIKALNSLIDGNLEINNDELTFATLMLFEGECKNNIRFSNTDEKILEEFGKSTKALGIEIKKYASTKRADWVIMGGKSGKAAQVLSKYGLLGHKCYTKRIPTTWFALNLKQKLWFVDLMFATDGYVSRINGQSTVCLANEGLIRDIQYLLSTIGIIGHISFTPNKFANAWKITVTREGTQKLLELITYFHKREAAVTALDKVAVSNINTYPVEIISKERLTYKTKKPPYRCASGKDISISKYKRLMGVFPELEKYWNEDFYLDEVESVTPVGILDLIHLEVSNEHNFIANGLVSHNTEMAVKLFIAWGLALNPGAKFIHLSYSDSLAEDNSETVKDLVESEEYQTLFNVHLKASSKGKKKWYTTEGGGVYATSTGGQITGFGAGKVDADEDFDEFMGAIEERLAGDHWLKGAENFAGAIVIDDANKPDDAESEKLLGRVNERYDSTISNRTNSRKTPIVLLQQRTHENDLSGYLIKKQGVAGQTMDNGKPGVWTVISLPSIKEDGTALCPDKHTIEELRALQTHNGIVFDRQHMQNPTPRAGLAFPKGDLNFYVPDEVDTDNADFVYVPCDPSGGDGGDDFAGLETRLIDDRIYVVNAIYNNQDADYNEAALEELVRTSKANSVGFEGVMGWEEMAKRVREGLNNRNFAGEFRILKPRSKKHTRIMAKAAFINRNFYFRSDYNDFPQYAKFMRNLTSYLKIQEAGKGNKTDDAPDVCEMAAKYYETNFPHLWAMK